MYGGQRGGRHPNAPASARLRRHRLRRQRLHGLDKQEEISRCKARYLIAEKPSKLRQIKNQREQKRAMRWEKTKARLRAKVEHPFRVIKRQYGYIQVRYRGPKNAAQLLTLFALSNLWMKRKQLTQLRALPGAHL